VNYRFGGLGWRTWRGPVLPGLEDGVGAGPLDAPFERHPVGKAAQGTMAEAGAVVAVPRWVLADMPGGRGVGQILLGGKDGARVEPVGAGQG
jgi:hypothetical protein